MTAGPADPEGDPDNSILDMLELERIDRDIFRAAYIFEDRWALYGGQVAAQALRAAGLTVEADRLPHSLHGYFLRRGHSSRPIVFQVFRDRDGGSFSARRVVALQDGEVIFNMAASFQLPGDVPVDETEPTMPRVMRPDDAAPYAIPRLVSFEGRDAEQSYPDVDVRSRFWARCVADLPQEPLLHASVLTYLSDISTGLARFHDEDYASSSSLDHAMWFHRPGNAGEWILTDCIPQTVAGGRGYYTGALWNSDGDLVASFAQEALFRRRRTYRGAARTHSD